MTIVKIVSIAVKVTQRWTMLFFKALKFMKRI